MLNGTSLASRLTVFLTIAAAVAVVVQLALCHIAVRRTLYEEAEAGYRSAADRLAHTIERSMADGMPLDMLPGAQQLIERRQAADPAIRRIVIADPGGASIYDTDSIGEAIPAEWWTARAGGMVRSGDGLVASRPLLDNAGQRVGAVFIAEDPTDLETQLNAILLRTARVGVLAVAAMALVAAAIAYGLVAPLRRWSSGVVRRIDLALSHPTEDGPPSAQRNFPGEAAASSVTPGASAAPDFVDAIASTEAVLRDAERELLRIGTSRDAAA